MNKTQTTYYEFLKSDDWKKFRKDIGSRDKWKCWICGSKERIEVHHIDYKDYKKLKTSKCICLCRDHHQAVHFNNNKKIPLTTKDLQESYMRVLSNFRGTETPKRPTIKPKALRRKLKIKLTDDQKMRAKRDNERRMVAIKERNKENAKKNKEILRSRYMKKRNKQLSKGNIQIWTNPNSPI